MPKNSVPSLTRVAGIHLSGANAAKTALVIFSCPKNDQFVLDRVYEKIGSVGSVFSDERLVDILNSEGPFKEVFIDCPLTLPPCARCVRPACPGAWKCDDVEVAYMLSIQEKSREMKKRRKPVNPQTQRLWDILQAFEKQRAAHLTYNASMSPLVTRAITLQRRLRSLPVPIDLKETYIPIALEAICEQAGLEPELALEYKKFGVGGGRRKELLQSLVLSGILSSEFEFEHGSQVRTSVETFQAFIAGIVGCLHAHNQTLGPPRHFSQPEGWVYLPT